MNASQKAFFHLTCRDKLPSILQHGLDPRFSKSSLDAVFLSGNPSTAANYAGMHAEDVVLLRIDAGGLDQAQLGPDNYELRDYLDAMDEDDEHHGCDWHQFTWQESLALCDQVAYWGVIPPDALTIFPDILPA